MGQVSDRNTRFFGFFGLVLLAISLSLPSLSISASASPVSAANAEGQGSASVKISPTFLNTFRCKPVTGKIYIKTDVPDTYAIAITGVPDGWLEYQASVYVDSAKTVTVNYMVNPKKAGDYRLSIKVSGSRETFNFEERLWVGRNQAYASATKPDAKAGPDQTGTDLTGGLTGMFVLSDTDQSILISAGIVIAALITVFVGHAFLKGGREADIWAG